MKPKKVKTIIEGILFIFIGFMLFFSDYRFHIEKLMGAGHSGDISIAYYIETYKSVWHIILYLLFVALGGLKIGGAITNGE